MTEFDASDVEPRRRRNPLRAINSAHLIAFAALIVALSGTALAAITSAEIKDNSIRSNDVRNGTLRSIDIHNGTLKTEDIASAARLGLSTRVHYYDPGSPVNAISTLATPIASLTQMPAGDYLVQASTSAFSSTNTNTADCHFVGGPTAFGGSFTHIATANRYYDLSDTAVVSLDAPGDIAYLCTFIAGDATATYRQIIAMKINSTVHVS